MHTLRTRSLLMFASVWLCGCHAGSTQSDLIDPDPARKIPAIKQAADRGDKSKARHLVDDLESDDSAVRLYAIHALKDLTGRTFGYRYYESDDQRAAAVVRWRAWLSEPSGK